MITAAYRRRRLWEAARACAAVLQQAPPLTTSATAAASGGRSSAGAGGHDMPADDIAQLRKVLDRFYRKSRSARRPVPGARRPSGSYTWRVSPDKVQPNPVALAAAVGPGRAVGVRLCQDVGGSMILLPLTGAAKQARQDQSVRLNKTICRKFDELDRDLATGNLPLNERLVAGQACLDALQQLLHYMMDDVNMSTFFHRVSRLVSHPAMERVRNMLDTSDVMPVLVQRFEALLSRIIRLETSEVRRGRGAPAVAGDGGSGYRGINPRLRLSSRSLVTCFWALGNMRYPLSQEQLDKIGAVIVLRYGNLELNHVSMLLLALNAYNNRPIEGKLMKVLLERTAQVRIADFEARTLLSIMCTAGSAGVTASQAVMDHLSLAALACLPEMEAHQLGSLAWSLGRLGSRLGANSISTPILHAISATAWCRLHELNPDVLSNILNGFGLLNFHPGEAFMDAAAARFKELLPDMTTQQVVNCVWTFARLEYSPATDRYMWAISSDSSRERISSSGYTQWAARSSEGLVSAAAAGGGQASTQDPVEQAAAAQARNVSTLAQRIAAHRAKREALHRLAAHAQEAMAAAMARGRGRGRSEGAEEVQPARQVVSENRVGDLVHFICTGLCHHQYKPRVVQDALSGSFGLEEELDRQTGITHVRPFYAHEQLYGLLPPMTPLPPWKQGHQAEDAADEEQGKQLAEATGRELLCAIRDARHMAERERRGAPTATAAAGVAAGELESLYAFFQEAAEEEAAGASEAAESILEDPELADRSDAAGGSTSAGAAAAAVAVEIDLDAVQETEKEKEAVLQQQLGAQQGCGGSGVEPAAVALEQEGGEASEQEEEEEPPPQIFIGDVVTDDKLYLTVADATQWQREMFQVESRRAALEERRLVLRRMRQQDRAAAAAAEPKGWRELDLSPGQLLEHLLTDDHLLCVPTSVKQRWAGAPRGTLDDAADRCILLASRMSGSEVSTLMWSYATMRHVHTGLFGALLKRVDQLVGTLSCRGVAVVLWSCAVTRQAPSAELADRLVDRCILLFRCHKAQGVDLHSLCNVAWALAVFGHLTPERFSELMGLVPPEAAATLDVTNTAAWCQFFQCALYLEAKTGQHYSTFLPPHILPLAETHWQMRDTTTSHLQNMVADVLHSLGVPFAEEYSPRANFFSIDIAIQGEDDARLAVEVDGPQHFASNAPHIPLASTYMRNMLLGMQGWEVVSVPFNCWAKLEGEQEKKEYLTKHVLSKLGKREGQ